MSDVKVTFLGKAIEPMEEDGFVHVVSEGTVKVKGKDGIVRTIRISGDKVSVVMSIDEAIEAGYIQTGEEDAR